MRYAILSDAHGNKLYFDKCINEISKLEIDQIIFLGDCFGYLREGKYIYSYLRKRKAIILMGNHEAMLLGQISYAKEKNEVYGLQYDRKSISKDDYCSLYKLKPSQELKKDGVNILLVHGKPDSPLIGYLYENDVKYEWKELNYDYIFMGHTHYPYYKECGKTIYINVGSCGLPRDIGNSPSFAILDTITRKVETIRITINIDDIRRIDFSRVHPSVLKCMERNSNE